jgi:hypothetical protein
MKLSASLLTAAVLFGLFDPGAAKGQFREGDGSVIAPPVPHTTQPADPAPAFANAYSGAGRPRIVLFWNRSLGSTIQSERYSRETTQLNASAEANTLDKQTDGPAGKATLHEGDEKLKGLRTVTKTDGLVDDNTRPLPLSERNAALLEAMFMSFMARGGVNLVDRTMIIRATAVAEHPSGGDPKLNEMQSLLKYADLLLQVLFVPDKEAPLGNGFQISLTDIRTGAKLLTWYSQAIPELPAAGRGRWVATDHGYVYQAAPAPVAGVDSVGVALGRDVMLILTQTFGAMRSK